MWAPFGSDAVNSTAIWRPEPNERGTFNILSTCVLTLVLCVWTSLHLNVPEHGKVSKQKWNKTLWLFVGLFMPEVVAFIAFCQWRGARNLHLVMIKVLTSEPPRGPPHKTQPGARLHGIRPEDQGQGSHGDNSQQNGGGEHVQEPNDNSVRAESRHLHEESGRQSDEEGHIEQSDNKSTIELPEPKIQRKRIFPWTKTHSHYALMGGFAFDTSGMKLNILPENRTRVTLTEEGVLELARHHLMPDISEETIKDKSKANEFAKTLVCLQAVWFCIQVTGRLATHYPISLLEMNTFAHAICCLCIYIAWWHKPLDIDEPTLIPVENKDIAEICAWMVMQSGIGVRRGCQANVGGKKKTKETWCALRLPSSAHLKLDKTEYYGKDGVILADTESYARQLHHLETENPLSVSQPTEFPAPIISNECHDFQVAPGNLENFLMPLTACDVECLRLARSQYIMRFDKTCHSFYMNDILEYVVIRTTNFPWIRYKDKANRSSLGSFFWLTWIVEVFGALFDSFPDLKLAKKGPNDDIYSLSNFKFKVGTLAAMSLYGSIHLLAWDCPFSNDAERAIWRASSIFLSMPLPGYFFPQPICLGWMICMEALECKKTSSSSVLRNFSGALRWILEWLVVLGLLGAGLYLLVIILYPLARVYVLVECFRNLWFLSQDVYKVPAWTGYIPHFGAG